MFCPKYVQYEYSKAAWQIPPNNHFKLSAINGPRFHSDRRSYVAPPTATSSTNSLVLVHPCSTNHTPNAEKYQYYFSFQDISQLQWRLLSCQILGARLIYLLPAASVDTNRSPQRYCPDTSRLSGSQPQKFSKKSLRMHSLYIGH